MLSIILDIEVTEAVLVMLVVGFSVQLSIDRLKESTLFRLLLLSVLNRGTR